MATLPLSLALPENIDDSRYECIDGLHLTERPLPGKPHAKLQRDITTLLLKQIREKNLSLDALQEWTVVKSLDSKKFMTPDVTVASTENALTPITSHVVPPIYLGVEILSPGQTLSEMPRKKVIPALEWGFAVVWVISPAERTGAVFGASTDPLLIFEDGKMIAGSLELSLSELFESEG